VCRLLLGELNDVARTSHMNEGNVCIRGVFARHNEATIHVHDVSIISYDFNVLLHRICFR
jgi:hypothetical protein